MSDPETPYRAAEMLRLQRGGMSATQAAREAGTTIGSVRRHFPGVLKRRGGRLQAVGPDNVTLRMRVSGVDAVKITDVTGSADRSLVGAHTAAIRAFLNDSDPARIFDFEGMTVNGVELLTDPAEILARWEAGDFDFLELYEPPR